MTLIEPIVTLEWATANPLQIIELAGRTAYKSEDKITPESAAKFVHMLQHDKKHFSVLEHAVAGLRIICDRGITHELVRHRLASFTQESTRYVNYSKDKHGGGDIQFILPVGLSAEKQNFAEYAYKVEENIYNDAISLGFTPQEARDFLPNGAKTEIVMTCNFREWLHVMGLRTSPAAHPKMRVVADLIRRRLIEVCPEVFS